MHEFLEEVAKETLSPEELRELLRRLAVTEFGGPEQTHLSDVAEATSTSVETLGRMLAQIRGETLEAWRNRFESTLASHQERLASLERDRDSVQQLTDPVRLYEQVEEGRRRKTHAGVAAAVAAFAVALVIFQVNAIPKRAVPASPWQSPHETISFNGHEFGYTSSGEWAEVGPGDKPMPVTHKEDALTAESIYLRDHGNVSR